MASRYWVGGTGNWDSSTTTHWSATSGGGSGASVPTSADNVFFNASSGGGTVTTTANPSVCANWDCTGWTGTFAGTTLHRVYGDLTLASGMTYSHSGILDMYGAGSYSINTSGKTLTCSTFRFWNGGTSTLTDHLVMTGNLNLRGATFDADAYNVTVGTVSVATNASTIVMGSGTWTLTATSGDVATINNALATITKETANIKITSATTGDITFDGGGKTYNDIWDASTGSNSLIIKGSNTFGDLKIDAGRTVKFTDGTTQTVTSLTCAAGAQRTLTGTSTAGWTISDTTGTNTVTNCTISYSTASGGATWDASGATNVNAGSNSGWLFPVVAGGNFFAIL